MDISMLTRLGPLGLVFLVAACSAGPQPVKHNVAFEPPRWTRVQPTAPVGQGDQGQLAGWNGGYLLVSGQPVGVRSSVDARHWHPVTPTGLTALMDPSAHGRMTAGYGPAAYVAGWSSSELAVWRTTDGAHWQETPLDVAGLAYHDSLDLDVSIAAGPRGVIVVGSDAVTPQSFQGFYVWRSTDDGRTFGQTTWVPMYGQASQSGFVTIGAVQETPSDFLVSGDNDGKKFILSSADGIHWTSLPAAGAIADTYVDTPIDGNASTVVAFNWNPQPGQPLAVYLRRNTWHSSTVDPGLLPDAGVVPGNQRTVNSIVSWGTGFIAIGNVNTGIQFSGMVWYSVNGSQWVRQPVRANGFDAVGQFLDAAVSKGKVLLVAFPVEGSDLLMWQSQSSSAG
jgi:hypothetical protein